MPDERIESINSLQVATIDTLRIIGPLIMVLLVMLSVNYLIILSDNILSSLINIIFIRRIRTINNLTDQNSNEKMSNEVLIGFNYVFNNKTFFKLLVSATF